MVVIEIDKQDLLKLIGKKLPDHELENVLFLLKCESHIDGEKIECELTPDRSDMLSVEGMAREIKGFLGIEVGLKEYDVDDSNFTLKKEKAEVRPFIACGMVVDVDLTDELVKSLMQIQEKLHSTIGRNRKKVAIGVHDLDKLKPPFTYRDVMDEKFIPLNEKREMTIKEILEQHPKGKDYAHLVQEGKYPMLYDTEGVMSFPPIINSERTKVTENTKNLFIDVTGTDERAVNQALNILVCNIAERGGKILTVKSGNKKMPDLEPYKREIEVDSIDKVLGFGLSEGSIEEILKKMRYGVRKAKGGKLEVEVPAYRGDVLHLVDIIEDVAIGYGYNNIQPLLPKIATIGKQSDIESLSRKIRELMVGLGFQETLNFILSNEEDQFNKMSIAGNPVEILNPTSSEFTICRTWVLPSLMKILAANKHRDYPQKIFEIGDCIVIDENAETRTKTVRKLAGVISHYDANLTEAKSIVESVLSNLKYKYEIVALSHPAFIESRCGEIFADGRKIGFFGELNPCTLEKWKLENPAIAFELDIE
ncbi:MAG: phenylalanine--tRNA ligase subunit beta [Candidatus Aenigmatarchaeota archaeon]